MCLSLCVPLFLRFCALSFVSRPPLSLPIKISGHSFFCRPFHPNCRVAFFAAPAPVSRDLHIDAVSCMSFSRHVSYEHLIVVGCSLFIQSDCVATQLFAGRFVSSVECLVCGTRSTVSEPFFDISVPIAPPNSGKDKGKKAGKHQKYLAADSDDEEEEEEDGNKKKVKSPVCVGACFWWCCGVYHPHSGRV